MNSGQSPEPIAVYCTRPNCQNPEYAIAPDVLSDTVLRRESCCPTCGMPTVLNNRYLPLQRLGVGGFGRTFLVTDLNFTTRPQRVLKQLCPAPPNGRQPTERQMEEITRLFEQEATVLNELKYERIPTIIDYIVAKPPADLQKKRQSGVESNLFYLVQEYVNGRDLDTVLETKTQISEAEVMDFLLQTLDTLDYIHQRSVIHRDIKPSNILRDQQGKYWLIDFGAVQQVVQGIPANQSIVIGTPAYASPEQKSGDRITPSSDLYSLAATAVSLLTGKRPLEDNLRQGNHWDWRSHLPQQVQLDVKLAKALDKALAIKPGDRFQSASLMRDCLIKLVPSPFEILVKIMRNFLSSRQSRLKRFVRILLLSIAVILVGTKAYSQLTDSFSSRFSWGDRLLSNPQQVQPLPSKQAGVESYKQGKYDLAIQQFEQARGVDINDPETLIFLNNAKAATRNPVKIAVSVPIGTNLPVAQEILRGVAQAQDTANRIESIPGRSLQVEIINDDNQKDIAVQVAQRLVDDPSILAVIGHNASDASLPASPIYNQGKLPMITPTSFAIEITGSDRRYTLRGTPNPYLMAAQIAEYMLETAGKDRVAVCFSEKAQDNRWFKDTFISHFQAKGKIIDIPCDFDDPNFDPERAVQEAIEQNANSLFLAPHVDDVKPAIDVLVSNAKQEKKLAIFSSPTLYLNTILQGTKKFPGASDAARGLVLSVPWHPDINANSRAFARQAEKMWGGKVNWRTATSYNSTLAVIKGLRTAKNREELINVIRDPDFTVSGGAVKPFKFSLYGNLDGNPVLVEVKADAQGREYFELLKN
jgi:ABC-type branched-subunit amino acid transport system substrate-binding protein